MDFCPLCNKRMRYTGYHGLNFKWNSKVNSKEFILIDEFNENLLNINLNTNIIKSNCKEFLSDISGHKNIVLSLGRECKKYHFYYSCFVVINIKRFIVKSIELHKVHLIRIIDNTHFVVNNDFMNNSTDIRITSNDFTTKEIKMKLNNFNLTRVKNIDNKLNKIILLT
jgi:hypothetical protein